MGRIIEVLLTVLVQGVLQALLAARVPHEPSRGRVRQHGVTPADASRRRSRRHAPSLR